VSGVAGVTVRDAVEEDVPGILRLFQAVYGGDYPYARFNDPTWLKRSIFTDDIAMLTAVEDDTGRVLGTASVVFDVGSHTDLIGELGRLAVDPEARGRGVGGALMRGRVERIEKRLHVAVVENRCVHPYSQRISMSHGFVPVGFLPMKHLFGHRESISLFVRYFGAALELRDNHPRIVPEAHALAHFSLSQVGIPYDAIVDEDSAPYPHDGGFVAEELSEEGLPALIRIERGRVRRREIFGPMRLQYGFFKLSARHATYLIAREPTGPDGSGPVVGAIGFIRDDNEKNLRIFELITRTDDAVRFLLEELLARAAEWGTEYVEVDVSALAPRMQRTLVELGFLPVAYIPAMVFFDVERLDVVRMARLLVPPALGPIELVREAQVVADIVSRSLIRQTVLPKVAEAVHRLPVFAGLNDEQTGRVAGACVVRELASGEVLFDEGGEADALSIVLDGSLEVFVDGEQVGVANAGEVVGELSTLTGERHSATVKAVEPVTLAVLGKADVTELTRRRPDISVVVYKNLAVGLGRKLLRMDERVSRPPPSE